MRRRFILTLIVFVCIASTGSLLYAAQEPADNPALVVSIDDDSLEIYISQSERFFAEFNSIKLQSSKDNTGIIAVEEKFEFFPDALEGATCFRFHYESNGILGDLCENSNNKHFKEVEASDFFWGETEYENPYAVRLLVNEISIGQCGPGNVTCRFGWDDMPRASLPTDVASPTLPLPTNTPTLTPVPSPTSINVNRPITFDNGYGVYVVADNYQTALPIIANMGQVKQPSYSPVDNRLAVSSTDNGLSFNIYVRELDGNLHALTNSDAGDNIQPDWSPNGNHIVFTSRSGSVSELYIVNANGGDLHLLRPNHAESPDWSPVSDQIVFSSRDITNGCTQLMAINANGTGERLLSESCGNNYPAWSPDGTKIAYVCNVDTTVCIMDASTTNVLQSINPRIIGITNIDWATNNGSKLLVSNVMHQTVIVHLDEQVRVEGPYDGIGNAIWGHPN